MDSKVCVCIRDRYTMLNKCHAVLMIDRANMLDLYDKLVHKQFQDLQPRISKRVLR